MVHPANTDLRIRAIAVRDDVGIEVAILEYRRSENGRLEWSQDHADADRAELLPNQFPVLRESREMEKVDRKPGPVGNPGYSPSRPWSVTFLLPAHPIEKLLGFGAIRFWHIEASRVSPRDLARDGCGRDLPVAEENLGQKSLPIERLSHSLSNTELLQDRPLEIEAHRHDAVRPPGVVPGPSRLESRISLDSTLQGPRQLPEEIDLAILERQHLHRQVGDDAHHESIEVRQPRLEVGRVPGEAYLGSLRIGDELEGTRPGRIAVRRIRLGVGSLIHVPSDDRRLGRVELVQQWSIGLLESKDHCSVVRCLDAGQ